MQGQDGKRNGASAMAGIDFEYVHAAIDFNGVTFQDVAVRYKGNGTYLESRNSEKKSLKVDLNEDNQRALYVPERFAHGYQTLHDNTDTSYSVGEFYSPANESGILYNDPRLGLRWPLPVTVVSEKDQKFARFDEAESEIKRRMSAI